MSIYGLKPTFTDYEGYKQWRKVWAQIYKDITARIRESKAHLADCNRRMITGAPMAAAWSKLRGEQVAAHKLNTVLDEAKLRMSNITKMRRDMEEHQRQFPLELKDCATIDFHFNKKHLEFPWIPMWCLKTKGQTYYLHHIEANAPWSTRETPDHKSTKGSLRFRKCDLKIDAEGTAYITPSKTMAEA